MFTLKICFWRYKSVFLGMQVNILSHRFHRFSQNIFIYLLFSKFLRAPNFNLTCRYSFNFTPLVPIFGSETTVKAKQLYTKSLAKPNQLVVIRVISGKKFWRSFVFAKGDYLLCDFAVKIIWRSQTYYWTR